MANPEVLILIRNQTRSQVQPSLCFDDHMAVHPINPTQRNNIGIWCCLSTSIYMTNRYCLLHSTALPRNIFSTTSNSVIQNPHSIVMINSKRLMELARKWQKFAAMKHRRIPFPISRSSQTSSIANKGHFVVYTIDNTRFTVPLKYLSKSVFRELLRISEEEFGLPSDRPITLPCDSTFLEYVMPLLRGRISDVMPLLRGRISDGLEKALLTSLTTYNCSALSSLSLGQNHQQTLISSY